MMVTIGVARCHHFALARCPHIHLAIDWAPPPARSSFPRVLPRPARAHSPRRRASASTVLAETSASNSCACAWRRFACAAARFCCAASTAAFAACKAVTCSSRCLCAHRFPVVPAPPPGWCRPAGVHTGPGPAPAPPAPSAPAPLRLLLALAVSPRFCCSVSTMIRSLSTSRWPQWPRQPSEPLQDPGSR